MSSNKLPSFNFPYTPSEHLRQFLVDYGRTGLVHVFKNGETNECVAQKKENSMTKMTWISEKPALPLNLPGKTSGKQKPDYRSEYFETTREDLQAIWDCEQPITNFISDHSQIVFGSLAEMVGEEAGKLSWCPQQQTLSSNNSIKTKESSFNSLLKRFETDFSDIPMSLLTDVTQESHDHDKIYASGKYCSNCLGFVPTHEESNVVLVYPEGDTMSKLCFSHLKMDAKDEISPKLCAHGSFDLPERICEISTESDGRVVAVRTDNKCWFFENFLENKQPNFLGNLECQTKPCSINTSPYIPEETVVAMETGSLWLWNAENDSSQVVKQCSACSVDEFDWYITKFGSHPRQVVRGNQTNVEIIDFRGGSATGQSLMTLPSPHFFTNDKFTAIQHHQVNPHHYYLSTMQALVVMDERFQQNPVLKWSHSLENPPKYISVLSDSCSQDVLIFAGSYQGPDIHCFQYCYGENLSCPLGMMEGLPGVLPPRSTSTPWKVSSYSEWPQIIHYPNKALSFPAVTERLSQPLLGLSCIPNHRSLTILQLSLTGDLFYQTLHAHETTLTEVREEGQVSYYEDFNLCIDSSDKKPLKLSKCNEEFIKKWVDCLTEQEYKESIKMQEDLGESSLIEDTGLIREVLFSQLDIENHCSLCGDTPDTSSFTDVADASSDDMLVCPYCDLTKDLSDQLNKAKTSEDKVLTKQSLGLHYEAERLKLFDFDMQCNELLGNVLLKNWGSTEQVPIDLTGNQSTDTENKGDTTIRWLETGHVTQSVAEKENGNTPVKKKSSETPPRQHTVANDEFLTLEGKSRNINQEFQRNLSLKLGGLLRSPRTPRTTPDGDQDTQDFKGLEIPMNQVHPYTPSQELRSTNLPTPKSRQGMIYRMQDAKFPPMDMTTVGQRKPVKKKTDRVPGF